MDDRNLNMKLLRHDLVSALTALLICAPAAFAQEEEEEKKEPDPKIEEKLDAFKDAVADKKGSKDSEAIALIDELLQMGPDYHPKDRRDILSGFKKSFRVRRKPDHPELYEATILAFGKLEGDDAAAVLRQVYELKLFDDDEWQSLRERILENIGRCKSERTIEFLLDETTSNDQDGLLRAAGKALRHFDESKWKTRKEIYERILTEYGRITGISRRSVDPGDATARRFKRTLSAISDGWNATLSAMSGQDYRTAEDWYKWYNDHKNKPKDWK